ncbi:hypothetical protein M405DRAFT_132973, partial [Rhizopogon salebrosus TDB-379]
MRDKEPISIKALTQSTCAYPETPCVVPNSLHTGPQTFPQNILPLELDDLMDTQPHHLNNHPTPTTSPSPLPCMFHSVTQTPAHANDPKTIPPPINLLLTQQPTSITRISNADNPSELVASMHAPQSTEGHPGTIAPHASTYTPNEEEQAILAHLALAETNRSVISHDGRNHRTTFPQFTPVPAGGFPHTHTSQSAQIFDFLDNQVLLTWFQVEHPKFIVRVFDHTGKDVADKAAILTERIRTNIAIVENFIHQDASSVKVIPPHRQGGKPTKDLPICFLVHHISEETMNLILSQRIWSAPDITFEARHFNCAHPPTLLFCLTGF